MNRKHFDIEDMRREYKKGAKQELEKYLTFVYRNPNNPMRINYVKKRLKELGA